VGKKMDLAQTNEEIARWQRKLATVSSLLNSTGSRL